MTWFKFDDTAHDHPKVKALTDRAFRWWVIGMSYASRYLTNGLLPKVFWKDVPNQVRTELSGQHLWDWDDPNFKIHDYEKYQELKENVEADKARNRKNAAAYRARKRVERDASPADVIGDASPKITADVYNPENREQRTDTENREQTTATPSPLRPLISGEANPRTWGKQHGEHVVGFCDWVCLPEFIFAEFCRKSGQQTQLLAEAYVRGWTLNIRGSFEGKPVGDNLKFWRARWSESHPEKVGAAVRDDSRLIEKLKAVEGKR